MLWINFGKWSTSGGRVLFAERLYLQEAADVANFAMMIADRARRELGARAAHYEREGGQ